LDFFAPHATEVWATMVPGCGLGPGKATSVISKRAANKVRDFLIHLMMTCHCAAVPWEKYQLSLTQVIGSRNRSHARGQVRGGQLLRLGTAAIVGRVSLSRAYRNVEFWYSTIREQDFTGLGAS
jgi:hypothetical protein